MGKHVAYRMLDELQERSANRNVAEAHGSRNEGGDDGFVD